MIEYVEYVFRCSRHHLTFRIFDRADDVPNSFLCPVGCGHIAWLIPATKMSSAHEEHLALIKAQFLRDVDRKYRAGAKQHGGKLWEKAGLIEMAMEECVDQYTFLMTLKQQRDFPEMIDPEAHDIDD